MQNSGASAVLFDAFRMTRCTRLFSKGCFEIKRSISLGFPVFLPDHDTPWPRLSGHDPRWLESLRDGFGHNCYVVSVRGSDDRTVGVLPLCLVSTRLFGKFLVSLPYLNSAGLWAASQEVACQLVDRAVALADQLDVKHLELRHEIPIEHPKLTVSRTDKVHMRLELEESPEAQMKTYKSKLRSQIKKNSENPFEIHFGAEDFLPEFYSVFATNMRDLGTPVYSKKLFLSILRNFAPDTAEIALVRLHGQAIAGALLIHQGGTSQVPSASSLRRFNSTGANLWMYSKLLERAIEKKSQRFDFGRSTAASGTYKFKEQWGAKSSPAVWQYYVRKGDPATMRPDSPKKQKLIETEIKLPKL
jgi:FemAB-related protein (PEP-CTERM system-associated)